VWIAATLLMIIVVQPGDAITSLRFCHMLIFGWWQALKWTQADEAGDELANMTFLILLGMGALPNSTRILGLVIQQRERPFLRYYKEGRFESIRNLPRRFALVLSRMQSCCAVEDNRESGRSLLTKLFMNHGI